MEHRRQLILSDSTGQPLDSRIAQVLSGLLPRLRREFPQLRDEVALTDVLEQAGRRIALKEQRVGHIEKLHGYAWVTVRSVATSEIRRGSVRVMQNTLDSSASHTRLMAVPAAIGTAEDVERTILLREVLGKLSQDERLVCLWKKAGFSSQEIAKYLGRSAAAVDTLFSRAKQKLRRALGTGRDRSPGQGQPQNPRRLGEEETETTDGPTRSAPW